MRPHPGFVASIIAGLEGIGARAITAAGGAIVAGRVSCKGEGVRAITDVCACPAPGSFDGGRLGRDGARGGADSGIVPVNLAFMPGRRASFSAAASSPML